MPITSISISNVVYLLFSYLVLLPPIICMHLYILYIIYTSIFIYVFNVHILNFSIFTEKSQAPKDVGKNVLKKQKSPASCTKAEKKTPKTKKISNEDKDDSGCESSDSPQAKKRKSKISSDEDEKSFPSEKKSANLKKEKPSNSSETNVNTSASSKNDTNTSEDEQINSSDKEDSEKSPEAKKNIKKTSEKKSASEKGKKKSPPSKKEMHSFFGRLKILIKIIPNYNNFKPNDYSNTIL